MLSFLFNECIFLFKNTHSAVNLTYHAVCLTTSDGMSLFRGSFPSPESVLRTVPGSAAGRRRPYHKQLCDIIGSGRDMTRYVVDDRVFSHLAQRHSASPVPFRGIRLHIQIVLIKREESAWYDPDGNSRITGCGHSFFCHVLKILISPPPSPSHRPISLNIRFMIVFLGSETLLLWLSPHPSESCPDWRKMNAVGLFYTTIPPWTVIVGIDD